MTVETVILSYAADDDGDKNVTLMIFLLRRTRRRVFWELGQT